MRSLNLKNTAGMVEKHIKTQLYHLEGLGQQTVFHLACEQEIHSSLSLLANLYSFYTAFSSLNVRENQIASYEDLIEANKAFATRFKTKREMSEKNRHKAMTVIDESERKSNLHAKMIGKQMLVWHQIVLKKNYSKAVKYLNELMSLQLKVEKKDPFFKQSSELMVFLSYFLVITNFLSGERRTAVALLKHQEQYRLELWGIDRDLSQSVDEYAKAMLKNLVDKIAQEHFLTASLHKREKIADLYRMLKEKFKKSAMVEIRQVIP